jgi:DnaK suppressor protein
MNIEKYKKRLLKREQELLESLRKTSDLGRQQPDSGALDAGDESVVSEHKESTFAQADRDTQTLSEVQAALRRIGDRSYGRCVADGEPIDESRLEALPWAAYCVKHQERIDAENSQRKVTL